MTVRVLVVEDDELTAEAHAAYVTRVPGFAVAGIARSAADAARCLSDDHAIDLILLDMHLPDGHGLALLRRLRASGYTGDVIAVTAARDVDVVRRAVTHGVVLYLIKPFAFASFRMKLEQYAEYRAQFAGSGSDVAQAEVDRMLGVLHPRPTDAALPKGMSADSLARVVDALRAAATGMSATEVAQATGSSRVTARRYLEHLADTGQVERVSRYGGAGRPEVEYRWA